ncbi:MAG: hypothetical protein BGO12_06275 [Verrucomicrobia bacterium 61-8]|nr:endo-1,4-beta-xylanase [Verrucomicrobiota bacterium]OJV13112.1 MAG: hypothetical protein BGO12_06275 [Verrucomicrobia bacterium 61-8]
MKHFLSLLAVVLAVPAYAQNTPAPAGAFNIAGSGETGNTHAELFPYLHEARVSMVRLFPEWAGIQPKQGEWDWTSADALVESARKNDIQLAGVLAFLTPWASSAPNDPDHGARTRTFPIKNIQYWRDFVRETGARYKNDITYWEVYNEFNATTFARNATPANYAELVKEADLELAKVNPQAKIGIGCADVDLSFLENVIRSGASGHFDFLAVHPYSLMDAALAGREAVFLGLGDNLRKLLKKTGQRDDIELWVTEVGTTATNTAASEDRQAAALVKAYTLCLAQDIRRVFWFEGRGPNYGQGSFGILRQDWSKRPAFFALQTMTRLVNANPHPLGWLDLAPGTYGFVLQGNPDPVLVIWASTDAGASVQFGGPVTVTALDGTAVQQEAGSPLQLSRSPVFVTALPPALLAQAQENAGKPFPWIKDYSELDVASVQMGASNVENGLVQIAGEDGDHNTVVELVDGVYARRTDKANRNNYINFDVSDSYASLGDKDLEITIVARGADPSKAAGFVMCYESATGYHEAKGGVTLSPNDGWKEFVFRVNDANLANSWGWNFRIDASNSASDVMVKEVRVKRLGPKK